MSFTRRSKRGDTQPIVYYRAGEESALLKVEVGSFFFFFKTSVPRPPNYSAPHLSWGWWLHLSLERVSTTCRNVVNTNKLIGVNKKLHKLKRILLPWMTVLNFFSPYELAAGDQRPICRSCLVTQRVARSADTFPMTDGGEVKRY